MALRKLLERDDVLVLTVRGVVVKIKSSGKRRDKENGSFYFEEPTEDITLAIDAPEEVAISTVCKDKIWVGTGGVKKAVSRP